MHSQYMALASVFDTDRHQLASLLDVPADEKGGPLWNGDELGAIFRHQLAASVQSDLALLNRKMALRVNALDAMKDKSFGDLLLHPDPPLEALKAVKDFAKVCRLSPRSPIPREIGAALYFASIAAALVRVDCRITSLTDAELADGFRWLRDQPWMDATIRTLAGKALCCLGARSEDSLG